MNLKGSEPFPTSTHISAILNQNPCNSKLSLSEEQTTLLSDMSFMSIDDSILKMEEMIKENVLKSSDQPAENSEQRPCEQQAIASCDFFSDLQTLEAAQKESERNATKAEFNKNQSKSDLADFKGLSNILKPNPGNNLFRISQDYQQLFPIREQDIDSEISRLSRASQKLVEQSPTKPCRENQQINEAQQNKKYSTASFSPQSLSQLSSHKSFDELESLSSIGSSIEDNKRQFCGHKIIEVENFKLQNSPRISKPTKQYEQWIVGNHKADKKLEQGKLSENQGYDIEVSGHARKNSVESVIMSEDTIGTILEQCLHKGVSQRALSNQQPGEIDGIREKISQQLKKGCLIQTLSKENANPENKFKFDFKKKQLSEIITIEEKKIHKLQYRKPLSTISQAKGHSKGLTLIRNSRILPS